MGTPHKHAEVIKAWADGAQVQSRGYPEGGWMDLMGEPRWYADQEYRVKPETIRYRVALFQRLGSKPFTITADKADQADRWGTHSNFVRWLTDWVEVEV